MAGETEQQLSPSPLASHRGEFRRNLNVGITIYCNHSWRVSNFVNNCAPLDIHLENAFLYTVMSRGTVIDSEKRSY